MSQSLSRLIVHVVFSTKDRYPFLDESIRSSKFAYLAVVARDKGWECYRVGGVADHVHLALLQPKSNSDVSQFVGILKRNSSKWIKKQDDRYAKFYWQGGFGAFSVSPPHLDSLIHYIDTQDEHHKQQTFKDEYRGFLRKYGIPFDERYIWD